MGLKLPPEHSVTVRELVQRIFAQHGVDPDRLDENWSLSSDGDLRATAHVRLTPAQALDLINGRDPGVIPPPADEPDEPEADADRIARLEANVDLLRRAIALLVVSGNPTIEWLDKGWRTS